MDNGFSSLLGFIQTNIFKLQILVEIKKEKILTHDLLMQNLKILFDDENKSLKDIGARLQVDSEINLQIHNLLKFKVNPKAIEDPIFELEFLYYGYCKGFDFLLRTLTFDILNAFVSDYCTLTHKKLQGTDHLIINLKFPPYLQKCKLDIKIL